MIGWHYYIVLSWTKPVINVTSLPSYTCVHPGMTLEFKRLIPTTHNVNEQHAPQPFGDQGRRLIDM